jgi:hypothetical protein
MMQPGVAMIAAGTLAALGLVTQWLAVTIGRICDICAVPNWIERAIDKALTQALCCKWFLRATNDRS